MSNEFYRAIAKRLIHFLRSKNLAKGERYWLRLDSSEMIHGINNEIKSLLIEQDSLGEYTYTHEYGEVSFNTYTLDLHETKVVFVFQQDGMKADYLATLRNEIPKLGYVSVYLVLEKLDTVGSATKLLSDLGMPFHEESLKLSIQEIIRGKSFTPGDRTFLDQALKNMEDDRFSDKSSVSGYETFLSIAERGGVCDDDFVSFRMLPDKASLDTCAKFGDKKLLERLGDNADAFEKIDQAFSRDEIKEKLGEQYKKQFVDDLLKKKSEDLDWQTGITFKDEQSSRKRNPNSITIELEPDAIEAVYLVDGNPLKMPIEIYYIKTNGETKAAQRKRHVLAFVPEDASSVEFVFGISSPVPKQFLTDAYNADNMEITATQARVRFTISLNSDSTFSRASLQKNMLSFAVLKSKSKYFDEIASKYTIDYKKKNSPSLLIDVTNGKLSINPAAHDRATISVNEGGCYTCYNDQQLLLVIGEDAMNDSMADVHFDVVCGGCRVPLSVKQDVRLPSTLDAVDLYREKTIAKRSYRWISDNRLQLGTSEFFVKDADLTKRLEAEFTMVKNGWLSADYENGVLTERKVSNLPERVESAFLSLLEKLREKGICLSLAFIGDPDIKAEITECTDAYREAVMSLPEGSYNYEGLLEIGIIYMHSSLKPQDVDEIRFTSLHPVNIAYQQNIGNIGLLDKSSSDLANVAIARLVHNQTIPYIYFNDAYYEASDITAMPEWAFYYKIESVQGRALGDTVARVTRERIEDFLNHFGFLFSAASNKPLRIACYNLGTCEDILVGITEYLFRELFKANQPIEAILSIHVDCYGDPLLYTAFENLLDKETLRSFLIEKSLLKKRPKTISEYECLSLLLSHLSFSLHTLDADKEYAHIAFIPGATSLIPRTDADSRTINTGIMLNGAIATSSATEQSGFFVTGYGTKDMPTTEYTSLITKVNQLHAGAYSQASLSQSTISVAVSKCAENAFDDVYKSANWVVLLDPKVDPMHFAEDDKDDGKLLVIHYEDRESSNGYNAITVTRKTAQYEGVIEEALSGISSGSISGHVRDVIDFANAFNGTWLLSFLHPSGTQTPRSRMSMLAAVKASLAHYCSDQIVWVPLSLEEMLRISTGLGLTAATEINSWKNLGFDREPMSDDILLVGLCKNNNELDVVLHPVEVKVGNCTATELDKGVDQALQTYGNFIKAYRNVGTENLLSTKVARNAFMQKVLISAEKMKTYGVLDSANWDFVMHECKEALQNENYRIVEANDMNMPKGTLCAFSSSVTTMTSGTRKNIRILAIPETFIPDVTIGSMQSLLNIVGPYDFESPVGPSDDQVYSLLFDEEQVSEGAENDLADQAETDYPSADNPDLVITTDSAGISSELSEKGTRDGIFVNFGKNLLDGSDVIWEPCNTDLLFHTNTGIIGTMGTGKTQFTKSLIAQLYCQRKNNPISGNLGILIFDYKGDYNLSQTDFVEVTGASVYRPYKLPFNPLSICKSDNSLPLLPKHIANTFKDTLVKACANTKLGAIQENTLRRFILDAYEAKGIIPSDPSTWDKVPPTFETVYRLYMDDEETKKNDSLASIMDKIHEFEIFESDPSKTQSLFDVLNGVTVIDLSGYDQDIQNLVVGIMVDLFYSQMHAAGHSEIEGNLRQLTKMILVDEADNFLSQGFPSLKKILKEGREFGVGTILSTQFLKHFKSKEEDYSKYILTWVVHSVADLDPTDIRFVFNTDARSEDENYLFNEVKKLGKHCSIVKLGDALKPTPMRDLAFWELLRDKKL